MIAMFFGNKGGKLFENYSSRWSHFTTAGEHHAKEKMYLFLLHEHAHHTCAFCGVQHVESIEPKGRRHFGFTFN